MKQLTVGKKVSLGFAGILVITMAIGIFTLVTAQSGVEHSHHLSEEYVPEASIATSINEKVALMQGVIRAYDLTGETDYLVKGRAYEQEVKQLLEEAEQLAIKYPTLVELDKRIGEMKESLDKFDETLARCEEQVERVEESRAGLSVAAAGALDNLHLLVKGMHARLDDACRNGESPVVVTELHDRLKIGLQIIEEEEELRIQAYKAQVNRDHSMLAGTIASFGSIETQIEDLRGKVEDPVELAELDEIQINSLAYRDRLKELSAAQDALERYAEEQEKWSLHLEEMGAALANKGMEQAIKEATATSEGLQTAANVSLFGLVLSFVSAVGLGWFISRSTRIQLVSIANEVGAGSERLEQAASMISDASTMLADSASRQASAIEETSATMEEMSSVTRANATRAADVQRISVEACGLLDDGVEKMDHLSAAMKQMEESSDKISKIISSIDEIAFQTNLLALNAAVEAARAGEAGAGFSVVAEEVRALAQRSALAARETTDNIEEALQKSRTADALCTEMSGSLNGIASRVHDIDSMVTEISSASNEQAKGIEQINLAISDIDHSTQENAAASEECSSNAIQLKGQSSDLDLIVQDLKAICGAETSDRSGNSPSRSQEFLSSENHALTPPQRSTAPVVKTADMDTFFQN